MLTELYIYIAVAFAGFISFLSPCVLPLVPPYLGYLGGTSVSQATLSNGIDDAVRRRIVLGAVFFVLGFTTVFVALGASASLVGQFVRAYQRELGFAAGLIIVLFGLHFLGLFRLSVLYKDFRFRSDVDGASFAGSYLLGLAFAFGWTPCIGPILGAVLAVAASEGSLAAGVSLLFVYSLGLGIPFVLAAVAVQPFLSATQGFKSYYGTVEKVMGAVLVITGLLFMGGFMNWIGQWMLETFPILAEFETWFIPEELQRDILNKRSN